MDLTVSPTPKLSGTVYAPPSKSITIRALVAGLLGDGDSTIRFPLDSYDTNACKKACIQLGAGIREDGDVYIVSGAGGKITAPAGPIDTENSGTTIRILTGITSLSDKPVTLTGDESIQSRPIQPLLDALTQLGVECSSTAGNPPHTVKGPLAGGECSITGDISSQFISSILMAAPQAAEDVVLELTSELKSRPYVDLTLDVLKNFGVEVINQNYEKFIIPAKQKYNSCEYTVEGDYSSAAFLLAAAALTESEVTVKNLFSDSKQADKRIVEVLKEMGAEIEAGEDSVTVSGTGNLSATTLDLSNASDLVPICSVLGALADGETIIENVAHARIKECDRIHAMAVELSKMGADIEEREDGLVIQGGALKGGAVIDSWHDHRIVMSMAVAGLRAAGETTIKDAEVAGVTFPNFADVMQKLGAGI